MKRTLKILALVALAALLLPLVGSGQQPNALVSVLDTAVYFPCSATVTTDCAAAWNVYDAATGQRLASVPSTAWTPVSGGLEADTPIPAGSRRYKNAYFARVELIYFDGQKEETSDSNIRETKRPTPPPVLAVK
jgi:hypothetical protein